MKKKFQSGYNFVPSKGEKNSGVSMTIPGEGVTIREMLLKHVRGVPIQGNVSPVYEDEQEGYDINPLRVPGSDLTDIDLMRTELDEINERIERSREAKKKKADIQKVTEHEKNDLGTETKKVDDSKKEAEEE